MAGAPGGEIVVYAALDGEAQVDVRLDHETVWLTQLQMAELLAGSVAWKVLVVTPTAKVLLLPRPAVWVRVYEQLSLPVTL